MAINFPETPNHGDTYQPFPPQGVRYRWNGTSGLWEGVPFNTALPFNYLVNPSFDISQEYGTTAISTVGTYPADQWHSQFNVLAPTYQKFAAVTPNNSGYCMRMAFPTAKAVLADTEYAGLVQYIEGRRIAAFEMGTNRAKYSVLRFWVRGSVTGTYSVAIRNSNATRGFAGLFVITSANVWQEQTIDIPPDYTGANWDNGAGLGMAVWFTFANGGPSLAVGAGGWYNANVIAGTGMSNGAAVANTTFDIADTGLYLDPYISRQAPHWEAVPEGKAFLDSQRYWWPCRNLIGASASTYGPARGRCVCPVPMRTAPSVAIGLVGGHPCYGWDAVAMNPMTTIGNYSTYTMLECDCNSATASYATGRLCQQLAEYPGYLAVSARM